MTIKDGDPDFKELSFLVQNKHLCTLIHFDLINFFRSKDSGEPLNEYIW